MLKIFRIFIMFVLIASISFSGCSNEESNKNGTPEAKKEVKELVFWFYDWGAKTNSVFQKVVNDFNASQSDVKVKFQPMVPTWKITPFDYKLLPAIVAGTPPDITHAGDMPMAVTEGMLQDISEYIVNDPNLDMNMYYPDAAEKAKYKGKYYGLPYDYSMAGVLMFNQTMFKKAGYDPNSPPKNIDEFDKMAEKMFLTDSNGDYTQIGFLPWEWLIKTPASLPAIFGGSLYDTEGNPTPTAPQTIKGYEWGLGYAKKYGYDKVQKYLHSLPIPLQPFKFGGVGMLYCATGHVTELIDQEVSFEWSLAPFPTAIEGVSPTWGGAGFLGIPVGVKHVKEATDFLKYISGREGQMTIMANFEKGLIYGFSAIPEVNQYYKDKWNPKQQIFIDAIFPSKPADPAILRNPRYEALLKQFIEDMYTGEVEVKQALTDIEKIVKAQAKE